MQSVRTARAARRGVAVVVAAVTAAAGCTGLIGEPGIGAGGTPGRDGGASVVPGGGGPPASCPADPNATLADAPLRRLAKREYVNTVRDLLGEGAATAAAAALPNDARVGGFDNNALRGSVSSVEAAAYLRAAEAATERWAGDATARLGCDPATRGEDACATQFVTQFGRRAFRRPLTAQEQAALRGVYDRARADGDDAATAAALVAQAALQSPQFLYLVERGAAATAGAVVPLTPHEIAARLSYALLGTAPDAEISAAADRGALGTADDVEREARRLLRDPRARQTVAAFHRQWLGLDRLADARRDAAEYPEFTPALRDAMAAETLRLVDHVVFERDADARELLTAAYTFVNAPLARLYGLASAPPDADTWQMVALDPAQRAGVLTQPALMTVLAHPAHTSPVHRGLFVREQLLCETLPPPPNNVMIVLPEPDPDVPTREQFARHSRDPACAGCHRLLDPLGLGFEHYDPLGRFRTTEGNGLVITAQGTLHGTPGLEGDFYGARELAERVAQSDRYERCVVRQWFRFAHGRTEQERDACEIERLRGAFRQSGRRTQELLVALLSAPSFTRRPYVAPEGP